MKAATARWEHWCNFYSALTLVSMEAVTHCCIGDFELASWSSPCLTADELSRQLCPLLLMGFFSLNIQTCLSFSVNSFLYILFFLFWPLSWCIIPVLKFWYTSRDAWFISFKNMNPIGLIQNLWLWTGLPYVVFDLYFYQYQSKHPYTHQPWTWFIASHSRQSL